MKEPSQKLQKVLDEVPKDLPYLLGILTTAGHLYTAGYNVEEHLLVDEGFPGCAVIYTPVVIYDDETEKYSHLNLMIEVRANALLTMQQIAEECNVNYRTIQRWRDENKIPVLPVKGKQLFPSEIVKDFAGKKGHISGRRSWR